MKPIHKWLLETIFTMGGFIINMLMIKNSEHQLNPLYLYFSTRLCGNTLYLRKNYESIHNIRTNTHP